MKRLFLSFLSLLSTLITWAYDFSATNPDGVIIYYSIRSITECQVTGSNPNSGNITIPASVSYNGNTLSVTSIGYMAFYDCTSLTSINLPNGVTSIGPSAFNNCTSLTSINLPNRLSSIGQSAFYNCTSLKSIKLPNGVTSIGDNVFHGCTSLTSIKLPNGVTSIGDNVFHGCTSLTSIALPSNLTSIGRQAFIKCTSLSSITLPETLTTIGENAFYDCSSLTSITLPESLTSIGNAAFHDCTSLTSINNHSITPQDISSIVFSNPHSCTLYVPYGSLQTYQNTPIWQDFGQIIERKPVPIAFFYAPNSDDVTIYYYKITDTECEVTDTSFWGNINGGAYHEDNIVIPSSVEFEGKTLIVTHIDDYAFYNCNSLTSISLPESIISIGGNAFVYCNSLSSITVDSANPNYSSLDGVLFNKVQSTLLCCPGGKQGSYNIPNTVTSIGEGAFWGCYSLSSIILPESLTSIGESAFAWCTSLSSIILPESLTSIGGNAFDYCPSLSSITNLSITPQDISNRVFSNPHSCSLYVPYGSLQTYQNTPIWREFGTIIELEPEPTDLSLYPNALYASPTEARIGTTVTIPINMKNSVTAMGFSFSLVLPEAITPDDVTLMKSKMRKGDGAAFSKAVQEDGSIKVVCYSSDGEPFAGNDGEVATLTFTVPADMEAGDYHLTIKNTEISENGKAHKIDEKIISLLHIENYLPGDANMDGDVSVSDLSCIVNYILGLEVPDTFYPKAADANEDGDVSVSDLSTIINILLYGNPNGISSTTSQATSSRYDSMGRPSVLNANAPIFIEQGMKTIIQ